MARGVYDFNDKWLFDGVWYDKAFAFSKNLIIKYYPSDNTLELYDKDCNRMFLKRTQLEKLTSDDFYIGNSIPVYNRHINITGYTDCRTQKLVGKLRERAFLLLLPNVIDKLGAIITIIEKYNFLIRKLKLTHLTMAHAVKFYGDVSNNNVLVANMVTGPVVALELVGENVIQRINDLVGPKDPNEAKQVAPASLRARFGIKKDLNGFECSLHQEDSISKLDFFFAKEGDDIPKLEVKLERTTCCLIKPHVIEEKRLGQVITSINQSEFKITGAVMLSLSKENADELLEIYDGVVSDYNAFLMSYLGGACVVLEIAGKNEEMDVHGEFRKFVGPTDSDMAKQIRSNSLRAIYGIDKNRNAIHCTDLPEDTNLELEYLFVMLQNA